MEGWVVSATITTAVGALVAAGAAIWLAVLNRQLVKTSQDEVRVSQELLSNQQRPVLVPAANPVFYPDHSNWLKWDEDTQPLSLRNVGPGTAFNVAVVLAGCSAYWHDSPSGAKHVPQTPPTRWVCWLGEPIASGVEVDGTLTKGRGTFMKGNDRIGDYTLEAPDEATPGSTATQGALWRVARMVITYHDLAGGKYASIFDYVHDTGWHKEDILPNIDRDLYDLEGYYRPVPAASPPLPALGADTSVAPN